VQTIPLEEFPRMMEPAAARPREQWWMRLREVAQALRQPPEGMRQQPT